MDCSLSNSMKLWTMSCRATLLENVVHWEGNDKLLQYSCFENPMNSMKRKKIWHWNELPRSEGAYYATGEECRNSSRKSEETVPKWKQCRVVDVTGDGSKVQRCKDQYCIQIWNVRSMNQGKLQVVKQEMARININILGISELKWIGMGKFNSDDHYIYYYGKKSFRRKGVAITVNKRVWNIVLEGNLKMTEWFLFISKANH